MINNKYYEEQNTPNTVSADRPVKDRSFLSVVYQARKPILDSEQNLSQDLKDNLRQLSQPTPSGFLRDPSRPDPFADFTFPSPADPEFVVDAFFMRIRKAMVAGYPLTVEYTDTTTPLTNLIQLDPAPTLGGTSPDVKRTDFVFLEVWPTLVAASLPAIGSILLPDASLITTGVDTVTIDGVVLTAVAGAPGAGQFEVTPLNEIATANNLATAINADAALSLIISADSYGSSTVYLKYLSTGVAGNGVTLATSNAPAFSLSGPVLSGGLDQPNKPDPNFIYRHGNVLSPLAVALPDDILSTAVGIESAQRVQLQYRIRVTGQSEAVNFKSQPDGFSNGVLAQGSTGAPVVGYPFVPADKSSSLANSDASAYDKKDPGLWISGDGSSTAATDLQSLSGFVYAIPICFVFRRNDSYLGGAGAGFDPINNTQGSIPSTHPGFNNPFVGVVPANGSDRPDGAFFDAINENDVLDLRRHIATKGFDFSSELTYQIQSLMDGQLKTWAADTTSKQELGSGSGDVSTQYLICNEIGRDSGHGGNNATSGDTTRGVTIRNFDHVARRFADQPVVERIVFELYPQDRDVGPVNAPGRIDPGKYVVKNPLAPGDLGWFDGDEIHLDLSSLNVSTTGGFDPSTVTLPGGVISDFAPPGASITDIISIRHDDGNWNSSVSQELQPTLIEGLGTNKVVVRLDTNGTLVTGGLDVANYPMVGDSLSGDVGSPRRVFIEIEYSYPKGIGLTDTPDEVLSPPSVPYSFGALIENTAPGARPGDMEQPLPPQFREGFREVSSEYLASENGGGTPIGTLSPEMVVSADPSFLRFPRRVYGSATHQTTVTDQETTVVAAVNPATTEYGSSSRKVSLVGALSGSGQTLCAVTYFGQDPIPNYGGAGGGYQVSIYYRSSAPQTAGSKEGLLYPPSGVLPAQMTVKPLCISPHVWSLQTGSGSVEKGFPYTNPGEHIPSDDGLPNPQISDWYFCASAQISISDFSANVGMLQLSSLIPVDSTGTFTFGGLANPPKLDAEFRSFYNKTDDNAYRPTAFGQSLSGASRHKVFTAMLVKNTEEGLLFRENEILLAVITRFAELDSENTVKFTDTNNRTSVALYRTRGLLILSDNE